MFAFLIMISFILFITIGSHCISTILKQLKAIDKKLE